MGIIHKTAVYLKNLPIDEYSIPVQISGAVNYFLDSFFAKEELLRKLRDNLPKNPSVDIQEKWLGCEYHTTISLNRSYPSFARNLNAWAFSKLFTQYAGPEALYDILPVLDTYQYKECLLDDFKFKTQYEKISIDLGMETTLPVHGTFFIKNKLDKIPLIVYIDLCFYDRVCKFSILSNPNHQTAAEQFIQDLETSIRVNDIYYKRCLMFDKGRLDFIKVTPTNWNEIILKDNIKNIIRDNSIGIIKNIEVLASIGMCPNRNVILISPPGMAKTTMFRAISNELSNEATRIWCTGRSITYAEDVTSLFEAARTLAPSIIFIEDMDLFGQDRSGLGGFSQILNEFLTQLDGTQLNAGVVILASTNNVVAMDEALINRPGRFNLKVEIPYPDVEDRAKMIQSFFRAVNAFPDPSITKDTWDNIIQLTDGFTGDYIKELVKCTVIHAAAHGRVAGNRVTFNSDDLMSASEQVIKNYTIGKRVKKHHDVNVDANIKLSSQ